MERRLFCLVRRGEENTGHYGGKEGVIVPSVHPFSQGRRRRAFFNANATLLRRHPRLCLLVFLAGLLTEKICEEEQGSLGRCQFAAAFFPSSPRCLTRLLSCLSQPR